MSSIKSWRGITTLLAATIVVTAIVQQLPPVGSATVITVSAPASTAIAEPVAIAPPVAPSPPAAPVVAETAAQPQPAEGEPEPAPTVVPAGDGTAPAGTDSTGAGGGGGGTGGDGTGGGGSGDGSGTGGPTTTTTPPPAPTTTLAPPTHEPELTFGVNVLPSFPGSHTAEQTARAVSDLAPGSVVRFTLPWQSLQLGLRPDGGPCDISDTAFSCFNPGPINWAPLDADLAALEAYGLRALLVPLSAPPWARTLGDLSGPNRYGQHVVPPGPEPANLTHWQTFVMELVRHVQADFPGLLAGIEVWNEPNGHTFWTTVAGPDPARYANILCYAYNGVKAVDPSLPVIFGGLNPEPVDHPPFGVRFSTFIRVAYAAGAGQCLDSFGFHAYPIGGDLDEVQDFADIMDEVRALLGGAGDSGRPVSITEVNVVADRSDAAMADFLIRAYRMSITRGDIDMFIVHTLYDSAADDLGLCAGPGQTSEAATAVRQEMSGATGPARC